MDISNGGGPYNSQGLFSSWRWGEDDSELVPMDGENCE